MVILNVGLPDLANENAEGPVKFEPQIIQYWEQPYFFFEL